MENKFNRTLITSALPYANGYIHLGHCAGAYLPADIYARYQRLKGEQVLWICGSDEHGVAITIAAEKEGVSPKDIIDKYHNANKEAFDKFGMTFDIYSRTSNLIHHQTAKEFFVDFLKKGLLIEREVEQFYDEKAKMFLPDRYVEGICPNCGYESARGDQCDNCGAYYDQLKLKNPKSLVSGETPVPRKTTHWYMQFNKYQQFLEEYIENHSKDWKENVLRQTKSWLKQGFNERAITRDLNWGVRIDDIEELPKEKTKGKVLYVWFEAVLGYISATKELIEDLYNKGLAEKSDDWKKWWQSKDTRYIAFIGKDNIVFHTLIFPILLYAKGENYILPHNVPANEFLNLEGQKFSKSRNWSIDLKDFTQDFADENKIDALRYSLAINFPETQDSDFKWKEFQARNNNELAAVYGNFVNRTVQFIQKNFDNQVPALSAKYKNLVSEWTDLVHKIKNNQFSEAIENTILDNNDILLIESLSNGIDRIKENYDKFRFREAIVETMNIARSANKYFNDEEPWKTIKAEPEKCAKTLFICSQLIFSLSQLFAPILPFTSKKISEIINAEIKLGEANGGKCLPNDYFELSRYPSLQENHKFGKSEILFTKIEDDIIDKQIEKLWKQQETTEKKEGKVELISYEEFSKIKLKTAKVLEAEKVKKSKKLIRLIVRIGEEKRQIVAGIAEQYEPEQLIGKTIVVVTNLQPAKLMGLESNGMLLAANTPDKLSIVTIENSEIPDGAEVR